MMVADDVILKMLRDQRVIRVRREQCKAYHFNHIRAIIRGSP